MLFVMSLCLFENLNSVFIISSGQTNIEPLNLAIFHVISDYSLSLECLRWRGVVTDFVAEIYVHGIWKLLFSRIIIETLY